MKSTGLGLTSMQERLMRLVGGELLLNSKPKYGTTIHARVPFQCGKQFHACSRVKIDPFSIGGIMLRRIRQRSALRISPHKAPL